eukprot:SAG11_NODE_1575_length_4659_cov_2.048904_2_plen_107_part_00
MDEWFARTAISSVCSRIRAWRLNITRWRWLTGVSRQAGSADFAAATAASISAAVVSGTLERTCAARPIAERAYQRACVHACNQNEEQQMKFSDVNELSAAPPAWRD